MSTTIAEIERNLKALGADATCVTPIDDRLFEHLVEGWRRDKVMPATYKLATEWKVSHNSISEALRRLVGCGRVFRVRRGVYVPKVVK